MIKEQGTSIVIRASLGDFKEGRAFIGNLLNHNSITKEIISETMLMYEALFHNILEQGFGEETEITISVKKSFGEVRIIFGFEGKMFFPIVEGEGLTPENRILRAYEDKIDASYHTGYNSVKITVKRSHSKSVILCFIGGVLAIVSYYLISSLLNAEQQTYLSDNFIIPLERVFTNAVLMVSAPVTFFSLLKNMMDVYIVSERNSDMRRLQRMTLNTSIVAIFLAVGVCFALPPLLGGREGIISAYSNLNIHLTPGEIIESMVPSSIFEPFEAISPFPLIIVASITTYAFISVGKYFYSMKHAVDACYTLFSKMLNIIIYALPFFSFVAFLDILVKYGYIGLGFIILLAAMIIVSLIVLFTFYLIRLKIGRVPIIPFIKKLPLLLWENFKINSAIDAVQFNVRYCTRNYEMERKRVEESLPVLAQVNLDGNCYLVTLVSLLFIFLSGTEASWFDIIVIEGLVLFLSLGAPNQPGTFLVGMMIITSYLEAYTLLPMVIVMEVFLGGIQNITNVAGDIVIVAIEDQRQNQRKKAGTS